MSKRIVTSREKPLVIGAGLVVLDIILNNGDTTPIFKAGGTCGNVLAGLSYLGWNSAAVARSGTDSAGKLMIKDLLRCRVNVTNVTREDRTKTPRIVERLNSNGAYPKHTFLLRCPVCHAYLPRFQSPRLDAVKAVISDHKTPAMFFFDRVSPAILELAKTYRDCGALIFFEPNNLNNLTDIERAIFLCHIIKYSGDETNAGFPDRDDYLLKKINPPLIIKTLGKKGVKFSQSKSAAWHYQRGVSLNKLKDTCGAGDWCTVGFLYFLNGIAVTHKSSLLDALQSYRLVRQSLWHAQVLSAFSCSFVGARGLSESVDSPSLIRAIRRCTNYNADIGTLIGSLLLKKRHTQISSQINDTAACPICLLV